jgi:hypothetical protein
MFSFLPFAKTFAFRSKIIAKIETFVQSYERSKFFAELPPFSFSQILLRKAKFVAKLRKLIFLLFHFLIIPSCHPSEHRRFFLEGGHKQFVLNLGLAGANVAY